MRPRIDLTGQSFGRLVVVAKGDTTPKGRTRWICDCRCGRTIQAETHNLRGRRSTSCGCANRDRLVAVGGRPRHGQSKTPTHNSWRAMIARCECPGSASYARYGAVGIAICKRWREDFSSFYADMGPRPDGMTLDRINNARGYEPGNCRWATPSQQAFNRRPKSKLHEDRTSAAVERLRAAQKTPPRENVRT